MLKYDGDMIFLLEKFETFGILGMERYIETCFN
jgi:hypothetical protein